MMLWGNDGIYDNYQVMMLQVCIYNLDGMFVMDQFQVGDMVYDGVDGYDVLNFLMIELISGLIVVFQVWLLIEIGDDEFIFIIMNFVVVLIDFGFVVV